MNKIKTQGVDHIGLAVRNLTTTLAFFTDILDFEIIKERPDYPAAFISDGTVMITLWQVTDPDTALDFDRHGNIGLHHLALRVSSLEDLESTFQALEDTEGVEIECAPIPLESGKGAHLMCIEPGGIRIEFIAHTT
jgi:catechol 2,3-dioxygenase-like lactoylglutathione lyase family enzyme